MTPDQISVSSSDHENDCHISHHQYARRERAIGVCATDFRSRRVALAVEAASSTTSLTRSPRGLRPQAEGAQDPNPTKSKLTDCTHTCVWCAFLVCQFAGLIPPDKVDFSAGRPAPVAVLVSGEVIEKLAGALGSRPFVSLCRRSSDGEQRPCKSQDAVSSPAAGPTSCLCSSV